jgi:DNA processing protein
MHSAEQDTSRSFQKTSLRDGRNAYAFALAHILNLSAKTGKKVLDICPTPDSWQSIDGETQNSLARMLRDKTNEILSLNWDKALEDALNHIETHTRAGIESISIQDPRYPQLLRLIDDPPLVLFVKGSLRACNELPGIAVIGTRNMTSSGEKVANKIASSFGEKGFCIISGLAKGIDSAAHRGAVDMGSPTVAVFATALDKVYPAENRTLANEILAKGGAWVSELPLFKAAHRNSFVERDRIQSGLSSAVIPVQTDVKGGTMHTVSFAEKQDRLLLCPCPIQLESSREQYRGITMLIDSGRAQGFTIKDYPDLIVKIMKHFDELRDRAGKKFSQHKEPLVVDGPQKVLVFESKSSESSSAVSSEPQALEEVRRAVKGLSRDKFEAIVQSLTTELFGN